MNLSPFPEIGNTFDCYAGEFSKGLTVAQCIKVASKVCEVPVEDILGRSKCKGPAKARQIAMWAARRMTDRSFPQMARPFDRDHTTIMHACQNTQYRIDRGYSDYREKCRKIINELEVLACESDPLEDFE